MTTSSADLANDAGYSKEVRIVFHSPAEEIELRWRIPEGEKCRPGELASMEGSGLADGCGLGWYGVAEASSGC